MSESTDHVPGVASSDLPQERNNPTPRPNRIRVELNIEKWPAIWQPASSNSDKSVRVFEREVSLSDGSRVGAKVEVGYTQYGTLTTEDQRMLYALVEQWEQAGKKPGMPVYFSDRVLSRRLRKRGWGTNVIEAMTRSLRRLRLTPIVWVNSFRTNDGTGVEFSEEKPLQILNEVKMITRKEHGHVTNQQGYFRFDPYIEQNLLANHTKPLLPDEFFKLSSEIAQLIYTHIDLVMFKKNHYERGTKELFYDLGLMAHPSYKYPSIRKQRLERAIKELHGIRLNHGMLTSITIQRTKDQKDYKVIFRKGASSPVEDQADETLSAPVVVNDYSQHKDPLAIRAEELVRRFYKIFHGIDNPSISSKQIAQAVTLIAQHGEEAGRFVVEFSATAAAETGYKPQTFGGILQYTPRALAALDAKCAAQTTRVLEPSPQQRAEATGQEPAEVSALEALAPERYQELYERVVAKLRSENPFFSRHFDPNNTVILQVVKAGMLKELAADATRSSVVLNPEATPEQTTPQTAQVSQEPVADASTPPIDLTTPTENGETGDEKIAA